MKSLFLVIACLSFNHSYSQIKGVDSYKPSIALFGEFDELGEKVKSYDEAGCDEYSYLETLDSIGVNKLWSELNSVLLENDLNPNKPSHFNGENPYLAVKGENDFQATWYKTNSFDKTKFLAFRFRITSEYALIFFYHESYQNLDAVDRREVKKVISEQKEIEAIKGIDDYRFSIAPIELGKKVNFYYDGHYEYIYRETIDSVGINKLWDELDVIISENGLDPDNPWFYNGGEIDSVLVGKGEFKASWYKINPLNKKEYIAFHFNINQSEAYLVYYIAPLKDLGRGSRQLFKEDDD